MRNLGIGVQVQDSCAGVNNYFILFATHSFTIFSTGIPAFRDFTIRDPRYFVILFQASFHDFEEKK